MENFLANIKNRLDFGFYPVILLPLIFIILTYPAMLWLPIKYTYENSLIENFQLIVLAVTFVMCCRAKTDKKFFYSIALLVIILMLREVNCGRTIFFAVEGVENTFYSWKEIKYGYLAHPLYGAFITVSALYFILTKSYKVLFKYIKKAKLSIYSWTFLCIGVIFAEIGEKIGNFALEEMTETVMYLSFMALIYLHGFNKKYIETVEN